MDYHSQAKYKIGKLYKIKTSEPLDLMVYNSQGLLELTGCFDSVGAVNDGDVFMILSHRRLRGGFGTRILTSEILTSDGKIGGIKDWLANSIEEVKE